MAQQGQKISGKNRLNIFELLRKNRIQQKKAVDGRRDQNKETATMSKKKDIIESYEDNFDNYTIIDYLTAFSHWVGSKLFLYFCKES